MKSKLSILILSCLFLHFNTFAQKDYSAKLKKEIVKIENGKYSAADYMFLKFKNGNTAQIKLVATCPLEVMSRDNFISFYSTYGVILLLSTFAESGAELPDIKEMDELIGDPDITYNFIIAKNGVQIQVITNEGKENVTMTWADVFED